MHTPRPPISPQERFQNIQFVIENIGCRPLARKAGLSASHVNRVLRGKMKNLVLETAMKIARAAQLEREDVIFYVEYRKERQKKLSVVEKRS